MNRSVAIVTIGWLAVFIAVALFRPLMPVDETRYLSVAWEMLQQKHWVLPTLNYEPYPHKPPLLFWLIRMGWEFFGVGIEGPRIIIFTLVGFLVFLTHRLARALFPENSESGDHAILALAAMAIFAIYASTIMFDSLLAVFVIGAMLTLWRASEGTGWKSWLILGVILGFGILAKGPVALVYILPAGLLAPLWLRDNAVKWRHWYGGLGIAVLLGAAIGLAWAIPAALQGGSDYAQRIFVTQSARRMVHAFDHVEPFWFYIPVLLGFLAPLLTWPALLGGIKNCWREAKQQKAIRFVLCWIIPVFIFFSAISSKQFHYMIPILPGFALLAAFMLSRIDTKTQRSIAIPLTVMLLPSIVVIVYEALKIPFFDMKLDEASEHMGYVHIVISVALLTWSRRGPGRGLQAIAIASFVLVMMIHVQLAQRFLPRFDIAPLAQAIQPYLERPMAATPKYDGEYGFVFRSQKPIQSIGREDVARWFAQNPNGVVIGRYKESRLPNIYAILFQQQFRTEEALVILEKK